MSKLQVSPLKYSMSRNLDFSFLRKRYGI